MSAPIVEDGKVVIFHYTLKNESGEVLDSTHGEDPMPYLHGHDNIVPGLEQAMQGCAVGDSFDVKVAPEDGYGLRDAPTQAVPREAFEGIELEVGMQLFTEDEEGHVIPLFVADVNDEAVVVDFNHPLAGETLFFSVEIVNIRNANQDELTHGHPHGVDGTSGHHH